MMNGLQYTDMLGSLLAKKRRMNEKTMQSLSSLKGYYGILFYFLKDTYGKKNVMLWTWVLLNTS